MQLKLSTDYAIRMTLYLAMLGKVATAADISTAMAIPKEYIVALAKPLRSAGILCTVRGANGGFALGRAPEQISLHEIVNLVEGTTRINRCLEEDGYCSRNGAATCPVHRFYVHIQSYLDQAFQDKTIASLLEDA